MNGALRDTAGRLSLLLLPDSELRPVWALVARAGLLGWIAAYGWWFHFSTMSQLGETDTFIHGINLIFHEAGHVLFGMLGNDFVRVLGGTLGQLLVPVVLGIAFWWKNRDGFAAALALWWFGQNLVDCAPYINDARMLQLTLLGGGTGQEVEGHDWEYLLTEMGWLNKDVYISRWVLRSGRWIMAAGLVWAGMVLLAELGSRLRRRVTEPA